MLTWALASEHDKKKNDPWIVTFWQRNKLIQRENLHRDSNKHQKYFDNCVRVLTNERKKEIRHNNSSFREIITGIEMSFSH